MRNSYDAADVSCLMDTRLSWKATGLLAYLLARRGQDIRICDLVRIKRNSKDSVCSVIKELESLGFIMCKQAKGKDGQFDRFQFEIVKGFESQRSERNV